MSSAAYVIVVGVVTLLGQVVLLREAGVVHHGSELAYTLGIGFWLLGSALGAAHRNRGPTVAGALYAAGWAAVPALGLARVMRPLLGAVAGAELDLPRQLLGLALVLVPVGFLGGAALRRVTNARLARGGTLARTYALESAGAAAGGLLATALPAVGAPALAGAFLAALVASAAGLRGRRRVLPAALTLAAVIGLVGSGRLDPMLTRLTHPDLLATRDTPYGRVSVEGRAGQVTVFVDDALAYENQGTTAEEFAALAAVQRARVGDVLVLGGWVEGLAAEIGAYRPRHVVSVEIDRDLLALAAPHLTARTAPAEVVIADPRRYLRAANRVDLIVSALPEPASGRANRFYTQEFFARCAASLADSGVLALRLRTAENLWTPRQAHRAAAIQAALEAVFADVVVLPGTETVFLASRAPLVRDPDVLAARFNRAAPATRLASPAWLTWRYTNDRTEQIARLLGESDVPANRDLRPTCYADSIMLDLARFFPGLGWRSPPSAGRWLWFALLVLLAPSFLARRRAGLARAWLAAYAGFAGMGLEIVLVLRDQITRGVLYRDLGLLLTIFMVGLALGARAGERFASGEDSRWRRPVLAAALSLWCCLVAWSLLAGAAGLAIDGAALLGTGALTALVFAAAAAEVRDDAGPLYAADLLGGGLGCLVTSLLLVPFAGLPAACLALAVLAFPAATAVWPRS